MMKGRGAYRPRKPSREAMICLGCTLPSKNCNRDNCKRHIEEMYQEFLNYKFEKSCPETFSYKGLFEHFYNAGYRKIPENAVVLTGDEYERFQGQTINMKKVRKETAEKFEEMARSAFDGINCTTFDDWDWFYNKLGEIAKELEGENGD